ncbi:hypothetical protein TrVFT333_011525 [Trichoderma virens FT-333]|nr:hypothetical protein TrVFT333_011525 [Trichoderma virens FT-333]
MRSVVKEMSGASLILFWLLAACKTGHSMTRLAVPRLKGVATTRQHQAVPAQYAVHPVPPPEFKCSEHLNDARLIEIIPFPRRSDPARGSALSGRHNCRCKGFNSCYSFASRTVGDDRNCASQDEFDSSSSANLGVNVKSHFPEDAV